MWGSSNPGNEDDWWYEYLYERKASNVTLYEQPSGFSDEAENTENLPGGRDYYLSLQEGKAEHWVKQFIEVQWGYSISGKPVVPTFKNDIHVAKKPLMGNRHLPLLVGFDPGMRSAMIFGQQDLNGRLLVLAELVQDDFGADRLCSDRLKPLIKARFSDYEVVILPDPAANSRSQTDERSVVDILKRHKFKVKFIDLNNQISLRLNGIEHFTTRLTVEGPALLIDPSCKHLIRALQGGWRYSLTKSGERVESPEKNAHSHPGDAFGYLARYCQATDVRTARRNQTALPGIHRNSYVAGV